MKRSLALVVALALGGGIGWVIGSQPDSADTIDAMASPPPSVIEGNPGDMACTRSEETLTREEAAWFARRSAAGPRPDGEEPRVAISLVPFSYAAEIATDWYAKPASGLARADQCVWIATVRAPYEPRHRHPAGTTLPAFDVILDAETGSEWGSQGLSGEDLGLFAGS